MIKEGLKVELDCSSWSEADPDMAIENLAITCGCQYHYSHTV